MTAQCGGEGRVGMEGGREGEWGEGSAVWKGRKRETTSVTGEGMLVWGVWHDTDTVTSKPPPGVWRRNVLVHSPYPRHSCVGDCVFILIFSSPHICSSAGDAHGGV